MFEQFKGQKFNLIYCDPAWQFGNKKTGGSMTSGAAHQYKSTMSVGELKAMPIDDITAGDCILVMWYVGAMPQEALDVVKAWGFELKNMNGFVWNKLTINNNPLFGMGFWTRAGSESAIIAIKGKPKVASRSVRAVGNYDTESLDEILGRGVFSGAYPIGVHSEKPKEFRQACVELAGDVPRIELFSRKRVKGWSVWGDEVGKLNKKPAGNVAKTKSEEPKLKPHQQEILCACGCGMKKVVRKADLARGWGIYFSKSCKGRHAAELRKISKAA